MGVERCVRYAFELAAAAAAQAPHAGAQDQRAHLRRRPVAAHVRRGRRRVPRRRPPPTTTSTRRASTSCRIPQPLRRDRHRQPVRRHPHRPRRRGVAAASGWPSSANLNPARTGPSMFEPVHGSAPDIAGTGQGQPDRRHPVARHDARVPRRGRRRRPHPQGVRRRRRRSAGSTSEIGDAVAARRLRETTMPITPTEKIWMNGELVDWDDAQIHVLTHTLHYGMGVFEGIRAYETAEGPAVFRLTDHIERLFNSAKIIDDGDARTRSTSWSRRPRTTVRVDRAAVVLHPADRLLRLRRDGPQHAAVHGRRGDRLLAVGRLPRRRRRRPRACA